MDSASMTWPVRTVALTAGMKPRALRQCFEIGALKLTGNDRKAAGSGVRAGLSRPRAYQAAIMKQLNNRGLAIPLAASAAFEFSNVGNINRAPGHLYEHGMTLLVVDDNGATVKNILFSESMADVSNSACVITVNVNRVVERVDAVLNNESNYDFT